VTVRDTDLSGDPPERTSLDLDSTLQFVSGEVASPRCWVCHATIIVRYATLRKHYCYMDTKRVRARTFGQWLTHQLERRDWSKAELARRIGVANGDVSRWARDERVPSPAKVEDIADALDVDVDYVLTVAGHRPPDVEIDPDSPTAQLMPLIEKIDWASRPGRIEEMEAELRFMIEIDRRKEAAKRKQ
jgi:transcriptional regulator with XRE-family HTH domain